MKLATSIILSAALVAINGCAAFQNPLVGKWDCKRGDESVKITQEFLQDGTAIYTFLSTPKTTNFPDGTSFTPESLTVKDVSTWKSIDGNRISTTNKSGTFVKEYKVEGDELKLKSDKNDGTWQSCGRIK